MKSVKNLIRRLQERSRLAALSKSHHAQTGQENLLMTNSEYTPTTPGEGPSGVSEPQRQSASYRLQLKKFKSSFDLGPLLMVSSGESSGSEVEENTEISSTQAQIEEGPLFQVVKENILDTMQARQEGKMLGAKDLGSVYDTIIHQRFEVRDMKHSLQLLLSMKEEVPAIDVLFFAKAMMYSSIKQHSLEDQILFFYSLDKLNLLVYFTPRFLYEFSQTHISDGRAFKSSLPLASVIQHFHTICVLIDRRKPDHTPHFKRLSALSKKRVGTYAKYGQGALHKGDHPSIDLGGQAQVIEHLDASLTYQQSLDILESYSYIKQGSALAIENMLTVLQRKFASGEMEFKEPDQAILLANSLVELTPYPRDEQQRDRIEELTLSLLQRCLDFLGQFSLEEIDKLDQKIIIFNVLLSDPVIEQRVSISPTGERVDIFNPEKLLQQFQSLTVAELQLVNKTPIVNFIAKALYRGDADVKISILRIFKDILHLGKNFHYEVSNRHIRALMIEILNFYGSGYSLSEDESHMLFDSLTKIIEYKITSKTLDFKTFIAIIEKDLDTSKDGHPLLWKAHYANYILGHLESKSGEELTFRELEVIQRLIERDQSEFIKDSSGAYEMTVKKTMDRLLAKDAPVEIK